MTSRRCRVLPPAAVATAVLVLAGGVLSPAKANAAAAAASPQKRLLSASELPAGWHAALPTATALDVAATPCLRGRTPPKGTVKKRKTATFVDGSGLPALSETLVPEAAAGFDQAVAALDGCRRLTINVGTEHVRATIGPLSRFGLGAHAYALALTVSGVAIGADIVVFRAGALVGELVYLTIGRPTPATARAIAAVAVAKAEGHTVAAPAIVSVVSSPVRIAHTAMGAVAYREVGSGPPLVMIMGFDGTMETWDPRVLDALGHDHEVVIFDNAGIGHTATRPGPLTVDEMAEQTGALIAALGFKRTDVLGWSMGAMIAEALAALHPAQVDRLILCAGYPGTGTVEPSQRAINALTSGTSAQAIGDLFPADRRGAAEAYELSLSDWPAGPSVPGTVVAAQEKAIRSWWSGTDPAGTRTSAISVPTLILDGAADRLDPQANARRLLATVPGSQLHLYPSAGHAFLFQDESAVVARVDAFLAG